jgi:hypothetical protein
MMILSPSCRKTFEQHYPISYNVKNNADSKITVVYTFENYYNGGQIPDSIINIEIGKKKTMFVSLYSYYDRSNPEKLDTLHILKTINIFKNDTVKSKMNYRLTKYWEYSIINDAKGELNLVVTSEDFNK